MNFIEYIVSQTGCTADVAWYFFCVEDGDIQAAIRDIRAGLKF